jgi:predicted metal-dependent enzyme (double-stranded beta helix superfamily)
MTNFARLRGYVRQMTTLADRHGNDEQAMLDDGARLLGALIAHDDWLPPACAVPSEASYRQYLLHCDPLERFCVVSFVWQPGQRTPVHDHLTWGLVGQLRGEERCDEYARNARGTLACTGTHAMRAGAIDRVSPTIGDVHCVSNASSGTSVSIHVYGANIGAVRRHVFEADGGAREFVSGYHNDAIPNLWAP